MCLLIIIVTMIVVMVLSFVHSAVALLPWTLSAGVLAGLAAIGFGKLVQHTRQTKALLSVIVALVLTPMLGYLGTWLVPPTIPLPAVRQGGLEQLFDSFDRDIAQTRQNNINSMLPVHLVIIAVLVAVVVSRYWYRWSPELSMVPEMAPPAEEEPPLGV
jgi:hypothetical protein